MSKFLIWGSSLLLAIFTMVAAPVQKTNAQPGVSVSFQTFYDQLSPHGQWIDDPDYGYVWSPRGVGRDFRPYYSGGNWAMTDYGNTWVSDYPWGWAPFHYGRWAYNPFYGWLWVPGTTWGPAWVHWRGGGSNYGWAPMGPGVNININIGGGGYYPPNDWWTFVPCNRIYHRGGYGRYWRGAQYNNTYINNTTIINNTYVYNNNTYVTGPRRNDVERTTGQRVNVYNVRNDNNPGRARLDGRNLNVYRPDVRQDRNANARPQNLVRAERGNRDVNDVRRNGNTGNADRNTIRQGNQPDVRSRRESGQPVSGIQQQRNAQVEQERSSRNREIAERQQREMQIQQSRGRETAERQQRELQMQQERSNRNREVAERQQREMQIQQNRGRETAERQQREMQMEQERSNRNRQMAMQQRQNEAQARIQQQRAAEQRAQQQQQIESRRQQRYQQSQPQPQTQQRSYEQRRGGNDAQRIERSQPQPNAGMSRGGDDRGRRR